MYPPPPGPLGRYSNADKAAMLDLYKAARQMPGAMEVFLDVRARAHPSRHLYGDLNSREFLLSNHDPTHGQAQLAVERALRYSLWGCLFSCLSAPSSRSATCGSY